MNHHSFSVQAPVAGKRDQYEGWLSDFDSLDVQFLVLDTKLDSKLLELARAHPQWIVDFADGESVLFARASAPVVSGIMALRVDCCQLGTNQCRTRDIG
jgi:hypothetical protein